MYSLKRTLLFLSMLLVTTVWNESLQAQISKGGTPPSFSATAVQTVSKSAAAQVPLIDLPVTFDVAALKKQDVEDERNGFAPRLAILIPASIDLFEEGTWTTLASGERVCRLSLRAADAIALSLQYSRFSIPEGGKLFIYNKDKSMLRGAYTSDNNPIGKAYATEFVAGDELVLEYVAPAEKEEVTKKLVYTNGQSTLASRTVPAKDATPAVVISAVGYGYNHLDVYYRGPRRAELNDPSNTCMININCSNGLLAEWQTMKNSIVRIVFPKDGTLHYCSGTLLNNTLEDLTPFIASAFHCFNTCTTEDMQQAMFYFHYEQPNCSNSYQEPPTSKTMAGAKICVNLNIEGYSDGSLVQLLENIPEDYEVFWSGWDRRNEPLTGGAGLHHPLGDAMKISIPNPATVRSGQWQSSSYTGAPDAHWSFTFKADSGSIAGGSSGSGLFNQEQRWVGSLTGGDQNGCENQLGTAFYGKLWFHWDKGPTGMHYQEYLAPGETKTTEYIDGRFLSGAIAANFTTLETSINASDTVAFLNQSYRANRYKWEFPGGTPESSTVKNPVVTYNKPGVYDVRLTINEGSSDPDSIKVKERLGFITVTQKASSCTAETIEVGSNQATDVYPFAAAGNQVYSIAIYKGTEFGRSGVIDTLSWRVADMGTPAPNTTIYLAEVDKDTLLKADTWENHLKGTTLVYSGASYKIANGWASVKLAEAFTYTGISNLKVLVHTEANDGSTVTPVSAYSAKDQAHIYWTLAKGSEVTGNGTVNDNRPDIAVHFMDGTCGRVPVADFDLVGSPWFEENFDAFDFPPTSWTVTKPGASANQWMRAIPTVPFKTIDSLDKASAGISPDSKNAVDSWLISPEFQLSQDIDHLSFYIGYTPYYVRADGARVNFYIKEVGSGDWELKWTTPGGSEGFMWTRIRASMASYKGKTIQLAWQYVGLSGDIAAIDAVRLYEKKPTAQVYEGDKLMLTDKSVGPPVSWNWQATGATPATAKSQDFTPTYMDAGTYDVSLKVKNNFGKDSVTRNDVVTVVSRPPIMEFASEGGYRRMSNFNYFIPVGASVKYIDKSQRVPKTWEWSFPGGNPTSSTLSSPTIKYDTEGLYDISLRIANTAGSADTTLRSYVRVGGLDTIWNKFSDDDPAALIKFGENGSSGYLTGSNDYSINSFAERFSGPEIPFYLSKVMIQLYTEGRKEGNLLVSIYSESNYGLPGDLWAQKTIPLSSFDENGYTTIEFDTPVHISETFFVTVSGFSNLSLDTKAAIYSSHRRFTDNTLYLTYGKDAYGADKWVSLPDFLGSDDCLSLNVAPIITYVDLAVSETNVTVAADSTGAEPKPVSVTGNVKWTASASVPWIKLSNTSGEGAGTFEYACVPNAGEQRNGVILIEGAGITRRIFVTQSASADRRILSMTATLDDIDQSTVYLSWGDGSNGSVTTMSGAVPTYVLPKFAEPKNEDIVNLEGIPSETTPVMQTMSAAKSLRWDNGKHYTDVGFNDGYQHTFRIATLFYPEDLAPYHGGELTSFEFYAANIAQVQIRIYQDEKEIFFKEMYDKITVRAYNHIDLSGAGLPRIDATKTLRFEVRMISNPFGHPASADQGPPKVGRGDLFSTDDGVTWYALSTRNSIKANWNMSASVRIADRERTYYEVYKSLKPEGGSTSYTKIAESDVTKYTDQQLGFKLDLGLPNNYCYKVKQVTAGTVSEFSNEACVSLKPILTVIAGDGGNQYGAPLPTSAEMGAPQSISGFLSGDNASVLTKVPSLSLRSDITISTPVGSYPGAVRVAGGESDKYNFVYGHSQYEVVRMPVTIEPLTEGKAYGDAEPVIDYSAKVQKTSALPFSKANLQGELARVPGESIGTYSIVNGTITNANNPNYNVDTSLVASIFTITKRPVTVKAAAVSKAYGDADPVFSYELENGIDGETLNGYLLREYGENVGTYTITQGKLDGDHNPNYEIRYEENVLTIMPRELIVTPTSSSKLYGDADPVIGYTVTGLKEGDQLSGQLSREAGEGIGQYRINIGTLSAGPNYTIRLVQTTFAIHANTLVVTAGHLVTTVKDGLPKPTYTMVGSRAEDEASLRAMIDALIYIDAPKNPAPGVYPIVFDEGFDSKAYKASFVNGSLTVTNTVVTAFTPGSGDENAVFMPDAKEMKVFDRSGKVIYEGNKGGWNGKNQNGEIVPAGIYYYTATTVGGATQKGSVEVYQF